MPFKSVRMTAAKLKQNSRSRYFFFFWSSTAQRQTRENASFGVRKKCSNQQMGLKFLTPKGNFEAFLEQIEPLLSQAFTYFCSSPTSREAIIIPFQRDLVPAGKGACVLPAGGRGGRHTSPAERASCFMLRGTKRAHSVRHLAREGAPFLLGDLRLRQTPTAATWRDRR